MFLDNFPLLSFLIGLPFVGAVFILFVRGEPERVIQNSRAVALWVSGLTLILSCVLMGLYNPLTSSGTFQFVENHAWIPALQSRYHLGVDGLSLPFVMLTALLTPLCLMASWGHIRHRIREYVVFFLLLESFVIGSFCALDLILFYLFFEATLIPLFFLIGIWGGGNRLYACFKFFLYTFFGSVFMVVAIVICQNTVGSTDYLALTAQSFSLYTQYWVWLGFFIAFAIKVPLWPVHTWLPDAHVEAPTGASMMLAGVLLKLGGYGILRFCVSLFPEVTLIFSPWGAALGATAIGVASLIALAQQDMKKMIAYSSVAHMGFVTLGIFSLTPLGISGAIFQMMSHGLISAGLFYSIGLLYDRRHTRQLSDYGGIASQLPGFSVLLMVLCLGSIGLPGTSGFIGEFLVLMGAYPRFPLLTLMGGTGLVLGAAYMLWLYARLIWQEPSSSSQLAKIPLPPLNLREISLLLFLSTSTVAIGLFPQSLVNLIETWVQSQRGVFVSQKKEEKDHNPKGLIP